jgi:IS30 family transposase
MVFDQEDQQKKEPAVPYRHLMAHEREVIGQLAAAGHTLSAIATIVGRSTSTISREIRRNSLSLGERSGHLYIAFEAQNLALQRRKQAPRRRRFSDALLRAEVERRLRERWSPEQISAVLKRDGKPVSHETIYAHVQRDYSDGGTLHRLLRRRHRRRRKRCVSRHSRLTSRLSIHQRPAAVEQRIEPGHWEGDTVVGRGGRIVTLVERVSRYLVAIKVPDGRSDNVIPAIRRRMRRLPMELRRTLTTDNGGEFAGHLKLTRSLGLAVYFADPHSPWQRGTNENVNGLLRQFIPKGSDFTEISRQRLAQVVQLLNNRPRKVLGYQAPAAVLRKPPDPPSNVALQS